MISLECIEDGCSFKSQELPFENAEKVLQMHLDRKHPSGAPPFQMMAPSQSPTPSIPLPTSRSIPSMAKVSSIPPPSSSPSTYSSSFSKVDSNSR